MELTIADRGAVQVAREIVLEHGWNATCYQILNPGIHLWFSAAHRALVTFLADILHGESPSLLSKRLHAAVPNLDERMKQHFKQWRRPATTV